MSNNNQKIILTGGRMAGRATLMKVLREMDFSLIEGHALRHHERHHPPEGIERSANPMGKPQKPKRRRLKRKPGGKL